MGPLEAQGQILTAVSTLIPSPVACSIEIIGIAPRRDNPLARAAGTRRGHVIWAVVTCWSTPVFR